MEQGREDGLIKIAQGEIVLVKTEKMAEFMEVRGADFFSENAGIAFGQIPEVVEVENNPRGRVGGVRVGLKSAGSLKEPKQVRLKSLVEDRRVRHGLKKSHDGFRCGGELGRKAGADFLNRGRGQGMKIRFQIRRKFKVRLKKSHRLEQPVSG